MELGARRSQTGTDATEQPRGDGTNAAPSSGHGEPAVHEYCVAKPNKRPSVQNKENKYNIYDYGIPIQ